MRIRTHPGEVLREEFLLPLGLSAHALALALHVPATRINDIVRERRSITADTAARLARYFGTTAVRRARRAERRHRAHPAGKRLSDPVRYGCIRAC